ncbi:MAG: hypothetical protein ACYCYO_01825 [Bacilli bacterium]
MTLYLTDVEEEALKEIAQAQNRPATQLVQEALSAWLERLEDPPALLARARFEDIMNESRDAVRGYVCYRGHVWWQREWGAIPSQYCPVCGSRKDLKWTWSGSVERRSVRTGK